MKIGDRVRDVYTGRTGYVLSVYPDTGRVMVGLGVYKMTGCVSWFEPVAEDDEGMVPR